MPFPLPLANLEWQITEKKWVEARRWVVGRAQEEIQNAESHKPDGTVAGSTKRLASRYYQLKAGQCRTGQYLHWVKVRPTAQCWWCHCPSQTREHLFKVCPEWKMQQKILWAKVQKETGRWKSRWMVRDLLADGRCGQVVLDFLSSTDVGRLAPPLEESDAGSEVSEAELREWEEEIAGGRGAGRRGETHQCSAHARLHGNRRRGVGGGRRFSFVSFLCPPHPFGTLSCSLFFFLG